jgi:hypothetical protein
MPPLSSDLKKAILILPTSEKDKLLLRLVAKDRVLCEQLTYSLVEEQSTLDDRRDQIRRAIEDTVKSWHYSPGEFMMALRTVNARITYHVKITKDTYGEVELTLLMLNRAFEEQLPFLEVLSGRSDSLAAYVAKRTQFILQRLAKLHADFFVEFEDRVNLLLQRVHRYAPAGYARELKLPKKWDAG